MAGERPIISKTMYDRFREMNQCHGKTLYLDLELLDRESPHFYTDMPTPLPKGVLPDGEYRARIAERTDVPSGYKRVIPRIPLATYVVSDRREPVVILPGKEPDVTGFDHGKVVTYQKYFDIQDRYRGIERVKEQTSMSPLTSPVSADIHVTTADHPYGFNYSGREVLRLGMLKSFSGAVINLEQIVREIQIDAQIPLAEHTTPTPDAELQFAMVKSFVLGLREATEIFEKQEQFQRLE
jgi:hypothetical protein